METNSSVASPLRRRVFSYQSQKLFPGLGNILHAEKLQRHVKIGSKELAGEIILDFRMIQIVREEADQQPGEHGELQIRVGKMIISNIFGKDALHHLLDIDRLRADCQKFFQFPALFGKIFLHDPVDLFQIEKGVRCREGVDQIAQLPGVCLLKEFQDGVLVLEMLIKGRSVDACLADDVRHGNLFKGFLIQQREESVYDVAVGPRELVGPFHGKVPFRGSPKFEFASCCMREVYHDLPSGPRVNPTKCLIKRHIFLNGG